jgi:hypothetical protein
MLPVAPTATEHTAAQLAVPDIYSVDKILIELPPEIAQPSLNTPDWYRGAPYFLELLCLRELLNAGCVDSIPPLNVE